MSIVTYLSPAVRAQVPRTVSDEHLMSFGRLGRHPMAAPRGRRVATVWAVV